MVPPGSSEAFSEDEKIFAAWLLFPTVTRPNTTAAFAKSRFSETQWCTDRPSSGRAEAATKIQSVQRGRKVRSETSKKGKAPPKKANIQVSVGAMNLGV
eukprot:s5969_g2.t1